MSKWTMTATFVAFAIFLSISGAGAEQAPLRIAMTMADIPLTNGAPDQGTEGIRFLGYTVYDPLVRWDLSRADRPAKLVSGLATSWKQDAEDRRAGSSSCAGGFGSTTGRCSTPMR
jgi:peptide/nickel transport system substrate-binding protein